MQYMLTHLRSSTLTASNVAGWLYERVVRFWTPHEYEIGTFSVEGDVKLVLALYR